MENKNSAKILVLDDSGTNLGRMSYQEAKSIAFNRNLDLIQVNSNNGTVVYKIMDYGKYKYHQKKHKQKKVSHPLKEMSFKLRIEAHDLKIKVERIKEFLAKGSEVKVSVIMKGREKAFVSLAEEKLDEILSHLNDVQVLQRKTTNSSVFVNVRSGKSHDSSSNNGEKEISNHQ